MKSRLPALVFAAVYVLVLATQLPHVWAAYASLEDASIPAAQYTAAGAALAFELSIGVFTYRIVKGSRRRWTKRGLMFFIAASVVANAYYYQVWPLVFDFVMRVFATLALPLALALFAEEFGAEERLTERRRKRDEKKAQQAEAAVQDVEAAAQHLETETKKVQVIRLAELHPEWNRARLAQEVGCSASTVTRALTTKVDSVTTEEG